MIPTGGGAVSAAGQVDDVGAGRLVGAGFAEPTGAAGGGGIDDAAKNFAGNEGDAD